MEKQEKQERQIARLKTIGKLELEKTELLSQMVFANAEEYNHLNIAYNALGVATDHLEIVAQNAREELNAENDLNNLIEDVNKKAEGRNAAREDILNERIV